MRRASRFGIPRPTRRCSRRSKPASRPARIASWCARRCMSTIRSSLICWWRCIAKSARPAAIRQCVREAEMARFSRSEILERLRAKIAQGLPIVGGGAGTGLSAKCEEAGGIDLIVIYNSGRYRMAGRGSLAGMMAYGNANEIVVDMAREVLPVVQHTPVLAGVNGTDPFMLLDPFLRRLIDLGFSGVQNFPTVGLIDGVFRANLEETGMGYGHEVDMIRAARALDLFTTP